MSFQFLKNRLCGDENEREVIGWGNPEEAKLDPRVLRVWTLVGF